jgi:carbon monoxide dehydrogenase subunit G
MGFIQSSQIRTKPGQSASNFNLAVNNLFALLGGISLISADVRLLQDNANDIIFSGVFQYRTGGLATYQADVLAFDPNAGTSFDAQVAAFYAANAATLFPRMLFDVTAPTVRQLIQSVILISEVVTAAGAGSFAVGDQQFNTKRPAIGVSQGNILSGATGTVRLYSSSGRFRDVAAVNKGAFSMSLGTMAIIVSDHTSQQLWAFPTCCDDPT